MRIGIAMSGGGVRATVFHLGVLARLAVASLLESVTHVSTVSGGSLAMGLVVAKAGNRWPSSSEFLADTLPATQRTLTTTSLQAWYAGRVVLRPWRWWPRGRAYELAQLIRKKWGITANLCDLPTSPDWAINATTYETGKCWRFRRDRMGDYQTQYVCDPEFGLAEALAASAAVPGVIGPLTIACRRHRWHAFKDTEGPFVSNGSDDELIAIAPRYRKVRLWDGGVYDNLGTEPLFKDGLRQNLDFLIVSDASRPLFSEARVLKVGADFYRPPFRLIDIATDQVRSLRARSLVSFFARNLGSGVYLRIGNSRDRIYDQARCTPPTQAALLDNETCSWARNLETTLRRLTNEEFRQLALHGYEVADATLRAYCPREFGETETPRSL